jgi:hypothetical protein
MDRRADLLNFAGGLSEAAAEGDWGTMAAVDRRVVEEVPRLAALGAWTPGERLALAELQRAHRAAHACCERALGLVEERMEAMRASRAAWCAYAESADFEEEGA